MSVDLCPICTAPVWADEDRRGPFKSQQAGYQYAHVACARTIQGSCKECGDPNDHGGRAHSQARAYEDLKRRREERQFQWMVRYPAAIEAFLEDE